MKQTTIATKLETRIFKKRGIIKKSKLNNASESANIAEKCHASTQSEQQ